MTGTGLYVHIPYCTSICPYCDFNAYVAPEAPWPALEQALLRELAVRASCFSGPLESIYFGGGTPSLAPPAMIGRIISAAQQALGLREAAEITLEANPGTLNQEMLCALQEAGVNRLSMGWQSTNNKMLRVLGRGHSAQDSAQAFVEARKAGFKAISLDLIFAVPGQSEQMLQADLDAIAKLSPEHVSLYAMTFKAGTPFERRRQKGTLVPVDETVELKMMAQINRSLTQTGYVHYEVSNYGKPHAMAVHNTLYWQGGQYLGIGPGAHSFRREEWARGWRWEAIRDPKAYIEAWTSAEINNQPLPDREEDTSVTFCEILDRNQLRSERLLCGLRHMSGVPKLLASSPTTPSERSHGASEAIARGWLRETADRLVATPQGLHHVDAIALLLD